MYIIINLHTRYHHFILMLDTKRLYTIFHKHAVHMVFEDKEVWGMTSITSLQCAFIEYFGHTSHIQNTITKKSTLKTFLMRFLCLQDMIDLCVEWTTFLDMAQHFSAEAHTTEEDEEEHLYYHCLDKRKKGFITQNEIDVLFHCTQSSSLTNKVWQEEVFRILDRHQLQAVSVLLPLIAFICVSHVCNTSMPFYQ